MTKFWGLERFDEVADAMKRGLRLEVSSDSRACRMCDDYWSPAGRMTDAQIRASLANGDKYRVEAT